MKTITEWIEIYKTAIRCTNCGVVSEVGQRMTKGTNLGFGCCVPLSMVPQNWSTSDAPQWILDLRN